jgi:heme b synthase
MAQELSNLRMVAWEVTRSCNLACAHCRAASQKRLYSGELTTSECFQVIDEIASFVQPVIILTGGEPLLRKDIFKIIAYGKVKGLTMVMAPNGTLLTEENTRKIIESGIKRISISLDGPDAATHDNLRMVSGAFQAAIDGINMAKRLGLEFQINSTITKRNVGLLAEIMKLAQDLGAKAYHIFLLVPTGRGEQIQDEELSAWEYEDTLNFLSQAKKTSSLEIKITCAPHFNRVLLQNYPELRGSLRGRGCMGGVSFCFISHLGELQPCGYLEIKCGNVRDLGFRKIWLESEVFKSLRDLSKYKGKCRVCEFNRLCGGCRARAYAKYKDYLAQEPYCIYEPVIKGKKEISCTG